MKFPLCLALLMPLGAALADPLEDARTVIEKVEAKAAAGKDSGGPDLKAKAAEFREKSTKMTPQEAAAGWISLFGEWEKAVADDSALLAYDSGTGFKLLLSALPPPSAWGEIQRLIAANPSQDEVMRTSFELFAATLCNDAKAQWKAAAMIRGFIDEEPKNSSFYSALVKSLPPERTKAFFIGYALQVYSLLGQLAGSPEELERAIDIQIELLAGLKGEDRTSLSVPDIARILGKDRAEALLGKAIKRGLDVNARGEDTEQLLRKLELADIGNLKAPRWSLVDGLGADQVTLFEDFERRFPKDETDPEGKQTALESYILSLVALGKFDRATAALDELADKSSLSFSLSQQEEMEHPEAEARYFEFLKHILDKDPALPYWGTMVSLALRLDKNKDALALTESVAARKDISPDQMKEVLEQLSKAFFAVDAVDRGIDILDQRIALALDPASPDESQAIDIALEMAKIGELTNRPAVVTKAGKIIDEAIPKLTGDNLGDSSVVDYLADKGRLAEAQQQVLGKLAHDLVDASESRYLPDVKDLLATLAAFYDMAGEPAQVFTLLKDAPWWGEVDLSRICGECGFRTDPLGVTAAKAFAATGDKAKAVESLKATVVERPSGDLVYGMLVEMEGQALIPFLDARFAADRFEERPLIWKALLLFQAGKLDEAEKTTREAIAIDPSDGEMGEGDRMRAYAVLADILEKKGNAADAKLYRNAVAAIRLAEKADDYHSVGLQAQAIAMYKEALGLFADAYCIQSRLAVQLADMGRMAEAEEHYRRAYELMPDSFGRMESHCFGCERAFKGELAESLAEKTFTKMLEKNPDKPQLHYLLGYLREEQGRDEDAFKHYSKAVELDPDYLNAWKKILSIANELRLPVKVRDDAVFALLRLDPTGKHAQVGTSEVGDLGKLWTLLAELRAAHPKVAKPSIFPLEASAKELARRPRQGRDSEDPLDPSEALSRQVMIQFTSQVLEQIPRAQE
jgi:tetratricopeptide (TPR) repeat protein